MLQKKWRAAGRLISGYAPALCAGAASYIFIGAVAHMVTSRDPIADRLSSNGPIPATMRLRLRDPQHDFSVASWKDVNAILYAYDRAAILGVLCDREDMVSAFAAVGGKPRASTLPPVDPP